MKKLLKQAQGAFSDVMAVSITLSVQYGYSGFIHYGNDECKSFGSMAEFKQLTGQEPQTNTENHCESCYQTDGTLYPFCPYCGRNMKPH